MDESLQTIVRCDRDREAFDRKRLKQRKARLEEILSRRLIGSAAGQVVEVTQARVAAAPPTTWAAAIAATVVTISHP